MNTKPTIAVLFGGYSSEYEVSLHSAAAVLRAINAARYSVVTIGITRTGQWLLYAGGIAAIEDDTWWQHPSCTPAILSPSREDCGLWVMEETGCARTPVDLVFPVMHGRGGEDGALQGLLELAGIPFVGCGSLASALCMDKEVSHNLALQAGIACPRFATVYAKSGPEAAAQQAMKALGATPLPWFVKPAAEGSSFGVSRVEATEMLAPALATAFRYGPKAVVEEGVGGFEVGCAVLGVPGAPPFVGEIDAISLAGGFFDFHEKYTLASARILLPAPLGETAAAAVKETALRLYALFGCKGLARVDLFYTQAGDIVFNEVNTMPGMTQHSRFPAMMAKAGLPFAGLVNRLLEEAMEQ